MEILLLLVCGWIFGAGASGVAHDCDNYRHDR